MMSLVSRLLSSNHFLIFRSIAFYFYSCFTIEKYIQDLAPDRVFTHHPGILTRIIVSFPMLVPLPFAWPSDDPTANYLRHCITLRYCHHRMVLPCSSYTFSENDYFFDISSSIERKIQALSCYRRFSGTLLIHVQNVLYVPLRHFEAHNQACFMLKLFHTLLHRK